MTKRSATVLAVLAVLALPYFVGLGHPDLWDANETLYAEPPREAVETGEWLVPTMNYDPWFVKPPGVTWLTIPFYLALGSNEFAGRLPMALAAAGTLLLTFALGRRLGGARAALLSAAFLATTAKFFMYSRQLAGDVFLTTALTAAGLAYLNWFQSNGERRGRIWLAAAILGPATLLKGPVALLLPGLFVPLHLLLAGRRDLFRKLRPLGPALLALLLAAPWFVFMAERFGREFYGEYFLDHHFARAFSVKFGSGRGVFYYPVAWLGDALPWSLALPGALVLAARDARATGWRKDPRFFPLLWVGAVLLFFTFSTGKRSVYLLPIYPAVALVLGITLSRILDAPASARAARFVFLPVLLGLSLMLPVGVWLIFQIPEYRPIGIPATAIIGLWAAILALALRRNDPRLACGSSFAILVLLGLWVATNLDELQPYRPARTFAERIAAEAGPEDASGRYSLGLQSLTFYGRRPFFHVRDPDLLREACRSAPHTWVVIEGEELPALTGDPALRVEPFAEGVYLQVSLPALLGRKESKRRLLLVRVTPEPGPDPAPK